MGSKRTQGYTLIEVVVSLAIFTILATISVGLLARTFDMKARIEERLAPLSDLNLALVLMQHDAHQIVNRAVYDKSLKKAAAFELINGGVEFTRSGYMPLSDPKNPSTLRRVGLICRNGQLIRLTWPVLDNFDRAHPIEQVLISGVSSCSFSFESDKKWSDSWHGTLEKPLPVAFKLHLGLKHLGSGQFIMIIPGDISRG